MPFKKSAYTLKKTCLRAICKNFDAWYVNTNPKDQHDAEMNYSSNPGPFIDFPPTLIEDLIESLKAHKRLRRQHLHYLLHPNLRFLDLSYGVGDMYLAVQFIMERCHNLQHLDMSYQKTIAPTMILQMLEALPCLQILNLAKTICLDTALGVIGKNCHNLLSLNIDFCPVSDHGIMSLCYDVENHRRQCQKLAKLDIHETSVSLEGAAFALRTLPNLRELGFDTIFGLFSNVNLLPRKLDGSTLYNLITIDCSRNAVSNENLLSATDFCPKLSHVAILHTNLSNDTVLLLTKLNHLTELSLGNGEEMTLTFYDGILPLLQISGGKLRKLALSKIFSVNIISINMHCPLLQSLSLKEITFYEFNSCNAPEAGFTNLKSLKISSIDEDDLQPTVLQFLLSHCSLLEELHVKRCACFDDSLINSVLNINPLLNLFRLVLEECSCITSNILHELLLAEGILQTVRIWSCDMISQNDYERLIQEADSKNLDIHFDWLGCLW